MSPLSRLIVVLIVVVHGSIAGADTLRLETTYDTQASLPLGESIDVDVYLDCDCTGSPTDRSNYSVIFFSVVYETSTLSYDPAHSSPNSPSGNPQPGINDPGLVIFGNQGGNRGAVISGGSDASTYYTASGGPHQEISPGRVLIAYTSKGYATGQGTNQGGEWYVGTLNFVAIGHGAPMFITLSYTEGDDEIRLADGTSLVKGTGQRDVKLGAPIIITPEPSTALLVGAGLSGLALRARRSSRA